MRRLSDLPEDEARAELMKCCASRRWVERMLSQRPFKDADEVYASAERIWWDLGPEDWHEAFRAHPRIGEAEAQTGRRADAQTMKEQESMQSAPDELRVNMAAVNREYEARFGWIYLVCATGRSADDLLALCRSRLANAPDAELKVAAGEQAKITKLRLDRLLTV